VKSEPIVQSDETVLPFLGKRMYTWAFNCPSFVVYAIGTRSGEMLAKVLGKLFRGIIGCDCYTVYFSYAKDKAMVVLQLCMAHLKRDFEYFAGYDLSRPDIVRFGNRGVTLVGNICHVHNELERLRESGEESSDRYRELQAELVRLKGELVAHAAAPPEGCRRAKAIAKRFAKYGHYYFTFMDYPGVQPTNNGAELAIRAKPVPSRRNSLGSKSCRATSTWRPSGPSRRR
jgi:hypothetical protein